MRWTLHCLHCDDGGMKGLFDLDLWKHAVFLFCNYRKLLDLFFHSHDWKNQGFGPSRSSQPHQPQQSTKSTKSNKSNNTHHHHHSKQMFKSHWLRRFAEESESENVISESDSVWAVAGCEAGLHEESELEFVLVWESVWAAECCRSYAKMLWKMNSETNSIVAWPWSETHFTHTHFSFSFNTMRICGRN